MKDRNEFLNQEKKLFEVLFNNMFPFRMPTSGPLSITYEFIFSKGWKLKGTKNR